MSSSAPIAVKVVLNNQVDSVSQPSICAVRDPQRLSRLPGGGVKLEGLLVIRIKYRQPSPSVSACEAFALVGQLSRHPQCHHRPDRPDPDYNGPMIAHPLHLIIIRRKIAVMGGIRVAERARITPPRR
jgi:hypothetical protein